jgi:Voltage gated chloride channel/CBS domain
MSACLLVGLLAGLLSAVLTLAVYTSEDAFSRLPIHWMWWPAIGGLIIGLGGLIFPQALGVGYDTLGALLQGAVPSSVIVGVLLVKSVIWDVRWCACAVADDGRRAGRHRSRSAAGPRRWVLGACEYGCSQTSQTSYDGRPLSDLLQSDPVIAHPDEPLRAVVYRMAQTGRMRLPVVERDDSRKVAGIVGLRDLLHARVRSLDAEMQRERVLPAGPSFGADLLCLSGGVWLFWTWRPTGFQQEWSVIQSRSDVVLGGLAYTWATNGPEGLDRVFGLVDPRACRQTGPWPPSALLTSPEN